jgi:hypothetical protein
MLVLGFGDRSRSAGAVRIVRRRAVELKLDSSHFRGKRRWSDDHLRQAVAESSSWGEVVSRLELSSSGGNVQAHLKSHTVRLGLDSSHLNRVSHADPAPVVAGAEVSELAAQPKYLRVAAETLAAAWFTLRGCAASLPIAPAPYDLLAETPEGIKKVQVKSTTYRHPRDGWVATVGHHPDTHARRGQLLAYDPDEIDLFFIVDREMTMYLIPSRAIPGRVRILLRTYAKYIVGNARGLLGAPDAGAAQASASA